MVVNGLIDKNLILAGIDGARYRNEEWFTFEGIDIRVPRYVSQSSLVIIGGDSSSIKAELEAAGGWVFVVPKDYFKHEGFSGTPQSKNIRDLVGILRRVGAQEEFTAVVALEGSWGYAQAIVGEIPSATILYARASPLSSESLAWSFTNEIMRAIKYTESNPNLWAKSSFLLPSGESDSRYFSSGVQTIFYRPGRLVPDTESGSYHFWRMVSSASAVMLSGGNFGSYIHHCVEGSRFLPYAGLLTSMSDDLNVIHMSGNQFVVDNDRLYITGFNLQQSKPANNWGSYVHKLFIESADGSSEEYKLGSLRREILDTLHFPDNGSSNQYGAYATPGHEGIDLSGFGSGSYYIRIIASDGYDTSCSGQQVVYVNPEFEDIYSLRITSNGIQLTVKRF